jgi:signal transduction histidine kinase
VTVTAIERDTHLRLVVEDRGGGVPDEFVPRLFDRFTRSSASRGRSEGAGLGLAIVQAYARAHGGDIVYEAAEPQGARFEIVLPVDA